MSKQFNLNTPYRESLYMIEVTEAQKRKSVCGNGKVGMAICNAKDNKLELVNAEFAKIHGYTAGELIGASPAKLLPHDEGIEYIVKYENMPSWIESDTTFETIHIKKDGSGVEVFVYITVIEDEIGSVMCCIA